MRKRAPQLSTNLLALWHDTVRAFYETLTAGGGTGITPQSQLVRAPHTQPLLHIHLAITPSPNVFLSCQLLDDATGMYAPLALANGCELPPTLAVNEATVNLRDWLSVQRGMPASSNAMPAENYLARLQEIFVKEKTAARKTWRYFTLYAHAAPVASGAVFITPHAVMLQNVATLARYQRQGFGSWLTRYMLQVAGQLGHNHCFLEASASGLPFYAALGFTQVGRVAVTAPQAC